MKRNAEKSDDIENSRAIKWLGIFGAWMLAAVIFTTQFYSQAQLTENPVPLWRAFCLQAASAAAWFALTPLVLWLGRHFPLKRGSFRKNLPAHLLAGAMAVVLQQAIDALTIPLLGYPSDAAGKTYGEIYREFLLLNFHVNYLIYWMTVGIQNLIALYREYRERELRSAQLEGQLAQARLQMLKNQLHPHFLFNTLNAVSELIYDNQEAAELMIANLSDLLRLALDKMHVQEVTLRQELEFLRKYLEIEQMRFDERLRVKMNIAPGTLDSLVPNLILQPLVENSIKHGLSPLADGGTVEISAEKQNGSLCLRVADNGVGLKEKSLPEGVGLSNTRARLKQLYGAEHLFEISEFRGGLQVDLQIPYRIAETDYEDKNLNS
jgi:sensor histidine kinase YesM